jgi:hypothetical protein
MADLGSVAWPPEPIRTERLVLRAPEARDRAAYIELLASPEVGPHRRFTVPYHMQYAIGRPRGQFMGRAAG